MIPGRPRLLSEADVHRARALYRSGTSIARLMALYDVSRATMWRRLKHNYRQPERACSL